MKTKYLLCILLLASLKCGLNLQAQTKLSGTVVDKEDRSLAGVSVELNNGSLKTATDINGKFTINYPDTLKIRRLSFRLFGYKVKNLSVNKGQETLKVILLDSIYNLGNVTVSVPRNGRFSDYTAQTIKMSAFDIETNPAGMADIIGGMRTLPGVQTNDNDGRLIIQGGDPDESQVYINDLIVANPYTLSLKNNTVRSRFTPDLFSGAVLQSGGFNAEFGQALSGIVNLNTIDRDEMEAKTDISLSSVFAQLTHIEKKPSYAYRASAGYQNLFLTDKFIGSEYDWKKPYQAIVTDYFLTKEFSPKTKITAQFNGNYSAGLYSSVNIDGMEMNTRFSQTYLYGQVNFYHTFNNQFSLSAASNLVIYKISGAGFQYPDDKSATENIWNHDKITLQYKHGRITNRTGVELMINPYNETYSSDVDYRRHIQSNLTSVYNDTKIFLTSNFTANIGLRGEYSGYLKKANVAPRLYLAYKLADKHIFSAALGNYFQLPAQAYLKMSDSLNFTSVSKVTAFYGYVVKDSKFQIDTYYKKYRNLPAYSPEQTLTSSGKGYGYGADVFWKSSFKSLEYWVTYSFNHTRKKYDIFPEPVAPPYVSEHSLNLTLKYFIAPLKSMVGASPYFTAGVPYYGNVFPYSKSGETPYHSRLDISWSYLPKQWLIIHFGFLNVLGRKNIYGYEYSTVNPQMHRAITAENNKMVFLGVFITLSQSKKLNQLKSL